MVRDQEAAGSNPVTSTSQGLRPWRRQTNEATRQFRLAFCLPSAFRSSLRSKKLVLFEIVTALCVRLFRPRFARPYKSSHLDQSGTSPLAKANKRGNSASLFCLPSAFRSSLRSKKLVLFEIVTAHCVRLFRPRFARPYKCGHLDRSGTSPLAKANKRGNSASLFVYPSCGCQYFFQTRRYCRWQG